MIKINYDQYAIISDFDGTISTRDTNDLLFREKGNSENAHIEKLFKEGKIGTREGMLRHFNELKLEEKEYVDFILGNVGLDSGFKAFYEEVKKRDMPLIIVSGGFENCIIPLMERENIKVPEIYANRLVCVNGKLEVEFLHEIINCTSEYGMCGNCKLEYLDRFRDMKKKVIFIGDGLTDRCIAEKADIVFAKNSLAKFCIKKGISFIEYINFNDIRVIMFEQ